MTNKNSNKAPLLMFIVLVFSACAAPQAAPTPLDPGTAVALAWTEVIRDQTANAPTPTLVQPTTETPLPTRTATVFLSPTPSSTPVPLNLFAPLNFIEELRTSPNNHIGKYIKALASNSNELYEGMSDAPTDPYWLMSSDYSPLGVYVNTFIDPASDGSFKALKSEKWLWIYGSIKETSNKYPTVSVFYAQPIPSAIAPRGEGIYKVGVDIAPGRWKSIADATQIQDCYWARIADGGSIIDNYFGYGGTTIYVSSTDFAVEINSCGLMVYLGE